MTGISRSSPSSTSGIRSPKFPGRRVGPALHPLEPEIRDRARVEEDQRPRRRPDPRRPRTRPERLASVDVVPLDAHNRFHLAESFALAGDTNRALDVLEQAVEGGFYPYAFMAEHCPFLAPLRPSPRFAGILAKARERASAFRKSRTRMSRRRGSERRADRKGDQPFLAVLAPALALARMNA